VIERETYGMKRLAKALVATQRSAVRIRPQTPPGGSCTPGHSKRSDSSALAESLR